MSAPTETELSRWIILWLHQVYGPPVRFGEFGDTAATALLAVASDLSTPRRVLQKIAAAVELDTTTGEPAEQAPSTAATLAEARRIERLEELGRRAQAAQDCAGWADTTSLAGVADIASAVVDIARITRELVGITRRADQ